MLSKADHSSQCRWVSANQLKALIEQRLNSLKQEELFQQTATGPDLLFSLGVQMGLH